MSQELRVESEGFRATLPFSRSWRVGFSTLNSKLDGCGTLGRMRLSVVIPVYNEEATVAALLDKVIAAPLPDPVTGLEVVAVDDCSSDETWSELETHLGIA